MNKKNKERAYKLLDAYEELEEEYHKINNINCPQCYTTKEPTHRVSQVVTNNFLNSSVRDTKIYKCSECNNKFIDKDIDWFKDNREIPLRDAMRNVRQEIRELTGESVMRNQLKRRDEKLKLRGITPCCSCGKLDNKTAEKVEKSWVNRSFSERFDDEFCFKTDKGVTHLHEDYDMKGNYVMAENIKQFCLNEINETLNELIKKLKGEAPVLLHNGEIWFTNKDLYKKIEELKNNK